MALSGAIRPGLDMAQKGESLSIALRVIAIRIKANGAMDGAQWAWRAQNRPAHPPLPPAKAGKGPAKA
jgi:hypothetical protein